MMATSDARELALKVLTQLRQAGFEALWAGGCVRDLLLGKLPKDYDVATSATPDQVRRLFGRRRTLALGASFGVITVLGPARTQVEVATFRQDAQYSDGRHPDRVTYSSALEDARRRDFTINGMFFDPLQDCVLDYVGGQEDLRRGIIRAIGDPDERIQEDRLRMLRAVRFAAHLDFSIEPRTYGALQDHACQIQGVSAERIVSEVRRMLVDPHRRQAVQLLVATGLLREILPELTPLWTDASGGQPAGAWQHTLRTLDALARPTFPVALAALLLAAAQPERPAEIVQSVASRWKLSREESETTQWLMQRESVVRAAPGVAWPRLQRILIDERIDQLLELAAALDGAAQRPGEAVAFCRRQLTLPAPQLNPPPLITGDDLQRAGFRAGPQFRILLEQIRDAQLEGRISQRDEALALARRLAAAQPSQA